MDGAVVKGALLAAGVLNVFLIRQREIFFPHCPLQASSCTTLRRLI